MANTPDFKSALEISTGDILLGSRENRYEYPIVVKGIAWNVSQTQGAFLVVALNAEERWTCWLLNVYPFDGFRLMGLPVETANAEMFTTAAKPV